MELNIKKPIMCGGEPCILPEQMDAWIEALKDSDGSYPDPIDSSPCDSCPKSNRQVK